MFCGYWLMFSYVYVLFDLNLLALSNLVCFEFGGFPRLFAFDRFVCFATLLINSCIDLLCYC